MTETAAANGLNTLMRTIGQAVCSAIVATVLASVVATHAGRTAPKLSAYLIVFVIAGASALVAVGLTLLIPTRLAVPARHSELAEAGRAG